MPAKLEIRGHAIECRINAEHPQKFTPSAGKITAFNVPGGNGIRVDTAQYAEGVIPPYYDSLIAKLIAHGVDRAEAIAKMERALGQFIVQGIDTSISLHQAIFQDAGFRAGDFDTGFMERFLAARGRGGEAAGVNCACPVRYPSRNPGPKVPRSFNESADNFPTSRYYSLYHLAEDLSPVPASLWALGHESPGVAFAARGRCTCFLPSTAKQGRTERERQ